MALLKEGVYPPVGKSLSSCPISGVYGNCTYSAVCAFQEKYNLGCVGIVGPKTLEKLNELYQCVEKAKLLLYKKGEEK